MIGGNQLFLIDSVSQHYASSPTEQGKCIFERNYLLLSSKVFHQERSKIPAILMISNFD